MLNKKWLVVLVLILAILLPTMALAATEAKVSLDGDKTSFKPGDTVTMKITLTGDKPADITRVSMTIRGGEQQSSGSGQQDPASEAAHKIDINQSAPAYDAAKGEITVSFVVPKSIKSADNYHCMSLYAYASSGKVTLRYDFSASNFEVVNTTTPEFDPPAVSDIAILENGKTLVPGDTLTVTMKATDASKITALGVFMAFDGPGPGLSFEQANPTAVNGVYTLTYTIPADTEPGVYEHMGTFATDEYDNSINGYASKFPTDAKITIAKGSAPIPDEGDETHVVESIDAVEEVTSPVAVVADKGEKKLTLSVSEYKLADVADQLDASVDETKVKVYNLELLNDGTPYKTSEATTIYLPYPVGYDKSSDVEWELRHYDEKFTTYKTEKVEATDKGLRATVSGFSPFALIWGTKAAPVVPQEPAPVVPQEPAPVVPQEPAPVVPQEPAPVVPQTPVTSTDVPKTGDNTPIALLMTGMIASLAAALFIRRKKAC